MDDQVADFTPASTVIDDAPSPSASGAGIPRTLDEPTSLRDTIAGVVKEQTAEAEKAEKSTPEVKGPDGKADDQPKDPKEVDKADEPKAEKARDERGKFAPKDPVEPDGKADDQPKDEARQDQDRRPRHPEAPQKFLPRAKELWPNVPNEVKGEVARLVSEHENETKAAREFITPLVHYHQMATQSGTSLPEALDRYVSMENALRSNPTEGFKALLANMEMQPQQAISHILKAFNVAPEALAQHIGQDARAYIAPEVRQQPQQDPRVSQLEQQLVQERAERIRDTVIQPFVAIHPRYAELEQDIAFFLQSGKIPTNLSQIERLEAAYDMAARINPASDVPAQAQQAPVSEPSGRAVSDLGGTKSIKSAPGSITPDMEPERGGSIRDILQDEVRRRRIA